MDRLVVNDQCHPAMVAEGLDLLLDAQRRGALDERGEWGLAVLACGVLGCSHDEWEARLDDVLSRSRRVGLLRRDRTSQPPRWN